MNASCTEFLVTELVRYGIIKIFSVDTGRMTYQVHSVPEPESPIPMASVVSDLLIYYDLADELPMAPQRFNMFCAAYRRNVVPVIILVRGLNNSKAAQEWVERRLAQNGVGRLFSTFFPAGDVRSECRAGAYSTVLSHSKRGERRWKQ